MSLHSVYYNRAKCEQFACGAAWALCGHDAPPGTATCQDSDAELQQGSQQSLSKSQSLEQRQQACNNLDDSRRTAEAIAPVDQSHGNGREGSSNGIHEASALEAGQHNSCDHSNQAGPSQGGPTGYHSSEDCHKSLCEEKSTPTGEIQRSAEATMAGQEYQPSQSQNGRSETQVSQKKAAVGEKGSSYVGVSIPMTRRVVIGTKCKRLIDHARLKYLLSAGFQVGILKEHPVMAMTMPNHKSLLLLMGCIFHHIGECMPSGACMCYFWLSRPGAAVSNEIAD